MNAEDLLNEIKDTNLAYLMLAQRLLKEDYATAQFRLKLGDKMADVLMSLSSRQMSRLARTNQFLFRPCIDDAEQLSEVIREKRNPEMMQTHAALVMAGAAVAA